jgi:hypothetical protein
MKNIQSIISLLVLFIALLPSCNKNNEDAINDYLPLKVGAKYKYKYSDSYGYGYESSKREGECTWKFISKSADTTVIYQVEQSFNGYWVDYYEGNPTDSTKIENQISALSFEVLKDGKVAFNFTYAFSVGGMRSPVNFERFIQSDKIDTCFIFNSIINSGCLRKNVGLTNFNYCFCGNHSAVYSYTLIEGPYY